jgi:alpha,alpha-trehalase
MRHYYLFFLLVFAASICKAQQQDSAASANIIVNAHSNLNRLLQEEDTNSDKRITIDDHFKSGGRGDNIFEVIDVNGMHYELSGTYYLANLLGELKLAEKNQGPTAAIYTANIFEKPVHRISRMIREVHWQGLTRQIDENRLLQVLEDTKSAPGKCNYLYVPFDDAKSFRYFSSAAAKYPQLNLIVTQLPHHVDPQWVKKLGEKHGLLALALEKTPDGNYCGLPYIVPGGRFNEMYGWDSYFETLGLLADGKVELAKAMVDNFIYQINHYGKILNANRTYYLTRSQPPFFTSMAMAVYEYMPRDQQSRQWLKEALKAAIKEYKTVWMSGERLTNTGLSRYYGSGIGQPPEVEPGHFDSVYKQFAEKLRMDVVKFKEAYNRGDIKVPQLDEYFTHDRSMRESGHDTTFRWDDRCADFVSVDLNSLLYKTERDIGRMLENEFGGSVDFDDKTETAAQWHEKAQKRKQVMNEYLWDPNHGLFLDYDLKNRKTRYYLTPAVLYPLWAQLATREQAELIVKNSIPKLEMSGGLAASSKQSTTEYSEKKPRQWEYPNGWSPHQMLAWTGLANYGFKDIAQRLTYRWLYTMTINSVRYNGMVPEKFDVVSRSHRVFTEYGNVGTEFDYITEEGFGWTNASYQVGLQIIPLKFIEALNMLTPPEWQCLIR